MELSFGAHQMGRILASLSTLPLPLRPQGSELGSGFPESRALPPPLSSRLRSRRGLEPLCLKAKLRAGRSEHLSPWDDKPYELLPGGRKAYLDEQDVLSFLDPPKELIPLDPASYNPAAYLWWDETPQCRIFVSRYTLFSNCVKVPIERKKLFFFAIFLKFLLCVLMF